MYEEEYRYGQVVQILSRVVGFATRLSVSVGEDPGVLTVLDADSVTRRR
jgi:hypothetical protein